MTKTVKQSEILKQRTQRLTAYTSAASAGAFAVSNCAHAAIVYEDFSSAPLELQTVGEDGRSIYNDLPLDVDSDGIYDIAFSIYNYLAGDQSDHVQVEKNNSAPDVKILTPDPMLVGDRFYPVQSFEAGYLLSSKTPEAVGFDASEIRLTQHDGLNYFEDPDRFLGLVTSGGFKAWVEIQIDTSNIKNAKIAIKGYAYENEDQPLPAGFMDEYTGGEIPEDVVTIPESSFAALSLGLLAAGAFGMKTWRRSKKSQ